MRNLWKKAGIAALVTLACMLAVMPALAANVFAFTEKSVVIFAGETLETSLRREGKYAGEGEVTYSSTKPGIATVDENGTITAVGKGQCTVTAVLKRGGKSIGKAQLSVKVVRRVTKVTLDTTGMTVYEPEEALAAGLIREETEYPVIVLAAGANARLKATCTPDDSENKKVTFSSSDEGVLKIQGNTLRGIQRGECELTCASDQNPEITDTYRVVVTQPVKKIQVTAPSNSLAIGGTLELTAVCTPDNATLKQVVWCSKNPAIARVDQNGLVTGVSKGKTTIEARAADGSGAAGSIYLSVEQLVTSISITQKEISAVVGRTTTVTATVLPREANDKTLVWSSSDETIATVTNGRVAGKKAGTCTITATSKSNPAVSASVPVKVSQLVTGIEFTNPQEELSFLVGEHIQLNWNVLPADATNPAVTFKSAHPKVATVDANGIVTGVGRGVTTITATAADGSYKQKAVKVTVIQPVEGVDISQELVYVQRGGGAGIRAVVQPRNANNQRVTWSIDDESVATVRSSGTSTAYVHGVRNGTAYVTGTTEDGGFTDSVQIRVADFNGAIMIEDLEVDERNSIRIVLRNTSYDLTMEIIHFKVECFDMEGNPMVCNTDGESTFFEGFYAYELMPQERTMHGAFRFKNYQYDQLLGAVIMTVERWTDTEGITWNIPESEQVHRQWFRLKAQQQ